MAYGIGSLANDSWNVYGGVEWQHNDALYSPIVTSIRSTPRIAAAFATIPEPTALQTAFATDFGSMTLLPASLRLWLPRFVLIIPRRCFRPGSTGALGRFQYLNGCQGLTPFTLTGAQLTNGGGNSGATAPADGVVCQQDLVHDFQMYNSEITRKGATLRGTKRFGDHEVFASFNYYNTQTYNKLSPGSFTGTTAAAVPTSTSRVNSSRFTFARRVRRLLERPTRSPATFRVPAISSGCNAGNGYTQPEQPVRGCW